MTPRLSVVFGISAVAHAVIIFGNNLIFPSVYENAPIRASVGIKISQTALVERSTAPPPSSAPSYMLPSQRKSPDFKSPRTSKSPALSPTVPKKPSLNSRNKPYYSPIRRAPSLPSDAPQKPITIPQTHTFSNSETAPNYSAPDIQQPDIPLPKRTRSSVPIPPPITPPEIITPDIPQQQRSTPPNQFEEAETIPALQEGEQAPGILMKQLRLNQEKRIYIGLIRKRIKEKFYSPGRFNKKLFVKITLEIGVSGNIVKYTLKQRSGVDAFDLTAVNAVKNVTLPPLPKELAKNPPYIVTFKFTPVE